MLGQHRLDSKTPYDWRLAGGPMMALFLVALRPSFPSSTKKTNRVGPDPL